MSQIEDANIRKMNALRRQNANSRAWNGISWVVFVAGAAMMLLTLVLYVSPVCK